MRKPNRACVALAVSAIFALSAVAESAPSIAAFAAKGFPDNADLRGKLFAYVIGASREVALKYGEKQLQSAAGPVTVRVENRSADFIVEFLNANAVDPGQAGRGSVFIRFYPADFCRAGSAKRAVFQPGSGRFEFLYFFCQSFQC